MYMPSMLFRSKYPVEVAASENAVTHSAICCAGSKAPELRAVDVILTPLLGEIGSQIGRVLLTQSTGSEGRPLGLIDQSRIWVT